MKKVLLSSAMLLLLNLTLLGQVNVTSWLINTTNDTYSGTLTDVEEIYYNNNYLFVKASGIPSYFVNYAGSSLFQPSDQGYVIKIPRTPSEETGTVTDVFTGGIGFFIDGTPVYHTGDGKSWDGSDFSISGDDIWHSLAWEYEGLDMDGSNGHSTATNAYHHHVANFELFDENDNTTHSPIVGWSFDGYPIYGPYAYSDPLDSLSGIVRMETSYQTRNITDRTTLPDGTVLTNPSDYGPSINSSYPLGSCEEDYEYVSGLGHLDEHNGRWCYTPEFPCGTYAYFTTMDATLDPEYPYHIGDTYYGVVAIATSVAGSYSNIPSGATLYNIGDDLCSTTVTVSSSDPTSCGGADGSASVTAVSGFGDDYCYFWSNSGTGSSQSSLSAGTYTVTVKGNGCSQTETITLTGSGSAPSYTTSNGDPSCGASDGTITLSASGGDGGPYTYSIDGGTTSQSSGSFSGLPAGTYNVYIEDGSGCTVSGTETLSSTSGPSISGTSSSDPSCSGDSDGDITITASGSGSLSYSIDNGSTFQSSNSFTTLSAGSYDIVVEDGSGCQSTSSVTISDPTAVSYSSSASDITCNGDGDGAITLTGTGGTGSFTYSIDNGVTFQSSGSFTSLSAGTYNVVIEDGNACQTNGSITISEPSAVSLSATETDVTCGGDSDGAISISTTGGTGSIIYSIDNGVTTQSSGSFTGLSGGSYNILVEDANGCTASSSATISEPTSVSYTTSNSDPTCGNADGSITITATGGTGSYTYSNDNGTTFQSSNVFSSLASGAYDIIVEDANGCQSTSTESLSNSGGPTISLIEQQQPCNGGADGSITITASGSGSLQYSIDGGTTFQSSNVFSGLSAGPIQVIVEDGSGCQSIQNTGLMDPPIINISGTTDDGVSGNDGSIDLTVTGGAGALSFSWSNGSTSEDISGLTAGTYTVTVTDSEGCSQTASFTIGSTVGIEGLSAASINVYPNPTEGVLYITSNHSIVAIRMFNTIGQQVSCDYQNGVVNLDNIPPGTYHLQIIDADGQSVYKRVNKI